MLIFKIKFTLLILLLPIIILLQCIFVLGISLISATLHTFYRDTKYIVEVLLLCGFYLTPIFYPPSLVPQKFQKIYMLNPMADMVTIYRDLLLFAKLPRPTVIVYTIFVSLTVFIIGLMIFRKNERIFADYV